MPCARQRRPIQPSGWAQPYCRSMMRSAVRRGVEGGLLGLGDELVVGVVGHIGVLCSALVVNSSKCPSVRGPLLGGQFVMVAGDEVAGAYGGERGRLVRQISSPAGSGCGSGSPAAGRAARAARRGWRLRRSGARIGPRARRAAAPACRGGVAGEDLPRGADLDEAAEIHDADARAEVADDTEVVGDEEAASGRAGRAGRGAGS